MQVRNPPLVGAPVLALNLVHFNLVPAPERELHAQAYLPDILNSHRIDLAKKDVEELASGPPALITLAELSSLTA
jgi:hypothetical protein